MQILETLINTTGSSSKSYRQRWEYFANKRPPLPHAICTEPLHPLPSALRHRREVPFGSAQEVTPALGLRRPTAAPASSSSAGLHLNLRRRPSFLVEPPASIFICAAALRIRDKQGRTGGCVQDGIDPGQEPLPLRRARDQAAVQVRQRLPRIRRGGRGRAAPGAPALLRGCGALAERRHDAAVPVHPRGQQEPHHVLWLLG